MILLIHAPSFVSWISKPSFKFHYDSINSALKSSGNSTRINDLNSIMILLIPDGSFLPCGSHSHLNSIMILLIHAITVILSNGVFTNLNSIMILLILMRCEDSYLIVRDLNSIMILLIPKVE